MSKSIKFQEEFERTEKELKSLKSDFEKLLNSKPNITLILNPLNILDSKTRDLMKKRELMDKKKSCSLEAWIKLITTLDLIRKLVTEYQNFSSFVEKQLLHDINFNIDSEVKRIK